MNHGLHSFFAVNVGTKSLAKYSVFSSFMSMKLLAEFVKVSFHRDPIGNRLLAVQSLGDQPIDFQQQLRMFGLNPFHVCRQPRATANCFVETAAALFFGKV